MPPLVPTMLGSALCPATCATHPSAAAGRLQAVRPTPPAPITTLRASSTPTWADPHDATPLKGPPPTPTTTLKTCAKPVLEDVSSSSPRESPHTPRPMLPQLLLFLVHRSPSLRRRTPTPFDWENPNADDPLPTTPSTTRGDDIASAPPAQRRMSIAQRTRLVCFSRMQRQQRNQFIAQSSPHR